MGLTQEQQRDRSGSPERVESVVHFRRNRPSTETEAATAIDLVHQAAEVLQSIEDRAAATEARAHGLARQAAEQLQLAESRMRALGPNEQPRRLRMRLMLVPTKQSKRQELLNRRLPLWQIVYPLPSSAPETPRCAPSRQKKS